MIITGLKIVWGLINCYHVVSGEWMISSEKKLSKLFLPVMAVLFKSTTMNKWELEAILHFFQVTGGSISSKYMAKSPVQSLFHLTNLKAIIFNILLKNFQNTSCNLKLFGNNLLTRNEDPSTASWIYPWPWQASQNGLDTPYITYIATRAGWIKVRIDL